MKHAVGTLCWSAGVSFVAAVIAMNWLVNEDPTESFLEPTLVAEKNREIRSVEFEHKNSKIFLKVHLNSPLTCDQVLTRLGITEFAVKEKSYTPVCIEVTDALVRITYLDGVRI